MQSVYISKLMELAEKDKNVIHVLSDSGTAYDELFRREFPDQYLNFGIAEEEKVAAAAGLATCGKIPFLYTSGAFLVYRALEFIRDDICYQNLNVKIAGMGSGLSWSSLGPSHHTTEDVGILRTIPNLTIFSPSTPNQLEKCMEEAYRITGPVYLRIGMSKEKEFFTKEDASCNYNTINPGNEIVLVTTGSIMEEVASAAELLKESGINTTIISAVKLKPFDNSLFSDLMSAKQIITIEEHNIYGGIGSIIAEAVAERNLDIKVNRIGLNDVFAVSYGTIKDVRRANRLDAVSISEQIIKLIGE